MVVHLLNCDYDPQARAMKEKGPFTLTIHRSLLAGIRVSGALLHLPPLPGKRGNGGDRQVALQIRRLPDAYEITIPSLTFWGLLELTGTAS